VDPLGLRLVAEQAQLVAPVDLAMGRRSDLHTRRLKAHLQELEASPCGLLQFTLPSCDYWDRWLHQKFTPPNHGATSGLDHGVQLALLNKKDGALAAATGAAGTPKLVMLNIGFIQQLVVRMKILGIDSLR
jgi:hypothetical protein